MANKGDTFIAGLALTLGFAQMLIQTFNASEIQIDEQTLMYMYMGILGNILWLIYQYRTGSTYYAVYSTISLFSQLYILYKVSSTERSREKQR
jgi:lipid-A-disaccharide synthase-like uncharacterized protein